MIVSIYTPQVAAALNIPSDGRYVVEAPDVTEYFNSFEAARTFAYSYCDVDPNCRFRFM